MVCKAALFAVAVAFALPVALTNASAKVLAVTDPIPYLSADRRAKEAVFLRTVKPNLTADMMTSDVLGHVGDRVAFICVIEERTRPGVVVGQCGTEGEPVDLYLKLPGTWRELEKLRVLGTMDTPSSWSDVGGHTIYYPFVNVVFADRLR